MRNVFLFLFFACIFYSGFGQVVSLYSDCGYRGNIRNLPPGRYNLNQIGIGYNQLSSFRVGPGLKVVLYDSPEPGQGNKVRYTYDVDCLGRDWNDRAQSILIEGDNLNDGNQQQPVYPSYGQGAQVMIFEDCGLRGVSNSLPPGRYDTRGMGIRNDALSSIRIPSGFSITVYKEGGFRGESMTFYSNVYCLDNRMNDQVSSIIVNGPGGGSPQYPSYPENPPPSSSGQVVIYDLCNYGGQSVPLAPGRYNYNSMGLSNDRVSSIRIPRGYRVTGYLSKDFQGQSISLTYDVSCLDGQWNNQFSSIIVTGPGGSGNSDNDPGYAPQPSYPPSNSGQSGATVYIASWFRGDHVVYREGRYDLRNHPIKNNISSIAIQPGFRVTVYEDYGFRGRSQTFTSSVINLNSYGWNDNIRSLVVSRNY